MDDLEKIINTHIAEVLNHPRFRAWSDEQVRKFIVFGIPFNQKEADRIIKEILEEQRNGSASKNN